jgi:hypothetical protein
MPNHHPAADPARHQALPTRRLRYAATAVAWLLVVLAALAAVLVLETAGRYSP